MSFFLSYQYVVNIPLFFLSDPLAERSADTPMFPFFARNEREQGNMSALIFRVFHATLPRDMNL